MARKRGGIAGFYDKFKTPIRYGATIGATLLGGPGAGAATNAAFKGFDRPGKRGIGFDVGQGIQGGIEGYTIGSGLKGMFAPKAASAAAMTGNPVTSTDYLGNAVNQYLAQGGSTSGQPSGNAIQRLLSGLTQRQGTGNRPLYYDLLSGLGKGLYSERQSQRTEALSRDRLAEERRQFEAMMGLRQQDAAIAAAQEADRKRREEQLMANRDALRALFTGA